MSKTSFVALYPTDFLADVGHLGNSELGIYTRLLLVYYRDQRPLPSDIDKLRRIAMTFSPEEGKSLMEVLSEFFVPAAMPDGTRVWRHKRADLELARASEKHAARVQQTDAARKARYGKSPVTEPVTTSVTETVTGCSQTENQNQNQITTTTNVVVGADAPTDSAKLVFDAGVALLAKTEGDKNARSLIGKMRKHLGDEHLLPLIEQARSAVNPSEYLIVAARKAAVMQKIAAENGGARVVPLSDGGYRCDVHFYNKTGKRMVQI